jgi:hypothetical protein
MKKELKDLSQFDALASFEVAQAKAKSCAALAARKAKAGGGIAAAAPALAKDISDAFGDGGEAGARRAYLAVCCSSKALAEAGEGLFETIDCEQGRALAASEKRALFQELRLLVDDRLEGVIESALTIGDFHLGSKNSTAMIKEFNRPEPIATSLALFGPSAMRDVKPKARAKIGK